MTTANENANENEIDLDALDKSATALLDMATAMKKSGFNLDNGTTHDERGTNQGTQPGSGDIGGVDNLQIVGRAKFAKALKDGGFTDEQVGKMVAKMFGDEDEDEETKKSRAMVNDLVKSAIQAHNAPVGVEPILKDLFAGTANAIERTDRAHGAFAKSQTDFNGKLARAFVVLAGELRSQTALVKSLAEKAGVAIAAAERAPVAPKTQLTAGGAHPLVKGASDGSAAPRPTAANGIPEVLDRRQLASVLSYMGIVKSIRVIDGTEDTLRKSSLIVGGGSCEPGVMAAALGFLHAHPTEVAKALAYGDTV